MKFPHCLISILTCIIVPFACATLICLWPQAGGKGRSLRHVSLARAEPSTPETFRSFLSAGCYCRCLSSGHKMLPKLVRPKRLRKVGEICRGNHKFNMQGLD